MSNVVKYLTLTNISPELKISSTVFRNSVIRMCVFTVLHSKHDKVKEILLCGYKVATYIAVTSLAIIHRLLLYTYMYMTV